MVKVRSLVLSLVVLCALVVAVQAEWFGWRRYLPIAAPGSGGGGPPPPPPSCTDIVIRQSFQNKRYLWDGTVGYPYYSFRNFDQSATWTNSPILQTNLGFQYTGTLPVTWSIVSGAPPGLSLNVTDPSTETSDLVGTPTTAGLYNVIVQVVEGDGTTCANTFPLLILQPVIIATNSWETFTNHIWTGWEKSQSDGILLAIGCTNHPEITWDMLGLDVSVNALAKLGTLPWADTLGSPKQTMLLLTGSHLNWQVGAFIASQTHWTNSVAGTNVGAYYYEEGGIVPATNRIDLINP